VARTLARQGATSINYSTKKGDIIMKKLLNLALGLVALVAFTSISAAQEKKSPSPAAVPEANTVTLSATSSNVISKKAAP